MLINIFSSKIGQQWKSLVMAAQNLPPNTPFLHHRPVFPSKKAMACIRNPSHPPLSPQKPQNATKIDRQPLLGSQMVTQKSWRPKICP